MNTLDLIEPNSTAVQRFIRRHGVGNYERPTAAAVLALAETARPGFVMFDIGANMGLYAGMVASMFEPSVVHAFEPAPSTAAVATRIARRNRLPVEVHQLALSDRDGTAELFLSPISDASNSLVEGFRATDETVSVPTATLDAFAEERDLDVDIVKLDVETHERAVLDGARSTIERCRPAIVIEVLRRRGRDHGVEIQEFFDGLGYRFHELSAEPSWGARAEIRGSGTTDRDWLLYPGELPDGFGDIWTRWSDALAVLDESTNPRVPVMSSVRSAYARGGWREVVQTADRYRRSMMRRSA
jgi:FkbM family methyltransferase